MIHYDLQSFVQKIATGQRIIGFDVGTKKLGVALSDLQHIIATPHVVIARKNNNVDFAKINSLVAEYNVGAIVVGWPIQMDGRAGEGCQKVGAFVELLAKRMALPIYLQDERMSTSAANRALSETNFTRKKKEAMDDKIAASYLLQNFLERKKQL